MESGFPGAAVSETLVDDAQLLRLFELAAPKCGETVLDLGTGTGCIAFPLALRFENVLVFGLDTPPDTRKNRNQKKAREMGLKNLQFFPCRGSELPFPDESVNTVVAGCALCRFPNIQRGVREIYRILKPRGSLVLSESVPNEKEGCGFVSHFMQKKAAVRVREYEFLFRQAGFTLTFRQMAALYNPRENPESGGRHFSGPRETLETGYGVQPQAGEPWVAKQVCNLKFRKS